MYIPHQIDKPDESYAHLSRQDIATSDCKKHRERLHESATLSPCGEGSDPVSENPGLPIPGTLENLDLPNLLKLPPKAYNQTTSQTALTVAAARASLV
jgi:hypothetical protein